MKWMQQFGVIAAVTCAGEILKALLPLPIPGSIYGLVLMLILLMSGILQLHQVKEAAEFLVETMPVMFIPAGVGLVTAWEQLQDILAPVCLITVITTFLVMIVTGKVTDALIAKKQGDVKDTAKSL